jgi:integrase
MKSASTIRFDWCGKARKGRSFWPLLSASEVRQLIAGLGLRERTLVLLDAGTGLRMSELFALKWRDINFQSNEISITRSIAFPVVGPCRPRRLRNRFRSMLT